MSLLQRLQDAYSETKNYEDRNFIPFHVARAIVTPSRIHEWSKSHPLCQKHKCEGRHEVDLLRKLLRDNILVFVVLVFANREFLMCELLESGSTDMKLFHTELFEHICQRASLSVEHRKEVGEHRKYVGVVFAPRGIQNIPDGCVLPFLKREDLKKAGANGVLYKVEIPGRHLYDHNNTAFYAEKRIRQDSTPIQDKDQSIFHEVEALQAVKHPNVILLLTAFTSITDESGYRVYSLHLLFPLAETDLAHWMTARQIPPNVANFSRQERQKYIYRSIFELVFGVSYLHKEIDGRLITHHDLKPLNILVVNDKLQIADFGHSHLRPIIVGSETEGRLGSYEYQPPEYYNQDGSRALGRYGRAFDVWAVGCIIVELATLIVHDWQSDMVNTFREKRKSNLSRARTSPTEIDQNSDLSFHNNLNVVTHWLSCLKQDGASRQLDEVLSIANAMLASKPENRVKMWEVAMDLHQILKQYDNLIPNLGGDLCIPPPLGRKESIFRFGRTQPELVFVRESIEWYSETPLHRAAKKNNSTRTIRLWELGWPLSLPDQNKQTPLDIMKRSEIKELRKLEEGVIAMIDAAKIGNTVAIKNLFSRGLSALMVNADGRSAMFEAVTRSRINIIDLLLETKEMDQLMLWDRSQKILPLHQAAAVGSVKVLERLLKHYPDVNIATATYETALSYAAAGFHLDAVRLLIKNKALLMPANVPKEWLHLPLHLALNSKESAAYEMVKLLLEAEDYSKCLNARNFWGQTPLILAIRHENTGFCELLIKAGASVHGDPSRNVNFLNAIAESGSIDILQQYIDYFSPADFEICNAQGETPLKEAQKREHKEVSRLLKSRLAQFTQSGSRASGFAAGFRNLKHSFKHQ